MKHRLALIIAVLVLLVAVGCQQAAPTPVPEGEAKEFTIGVANFVLGAPYFVAMSDAAEEEAAYFGNVTVITTDGQGDAEKMTSDIAYS